MAQVFNEKYKEVIEEVLSYDMAFFDKLTTLIEELSEAKDEEGDYLYDYGTIAKAVLEFMEVING